MVQKHRLRLVVYPIIYGPGFRRIPSGDRRISEPPTVVFIDFQPIAVFVFYGSFMVVDDQCLSLPEKKSSST